MRLTPARRTKRSSVHCRKIAIGCVIFLRRATGQKIAGWRNDPAAGRGGRSGMSVRRCLGNRDRVILLSPRLAKGMTTTHMNWRFALQIRQLREIVFETLGVELNIH